MEYISNSPAETEALGEALAARYMLCDNLRRAGYDPEEMVLGRIERDMDKYFTAFNLVNLNDLL